MTVPRRCRSFFLLVCLVLAGTTLLVSSGGAQTSVPAGEYTPAFPDGPPIDIPEIDPPTEEPEPDPQVPNPNEPNPNEPNPNEPNPNEPIPNQPHPNQPGSIDPDPNEPDLNEPDPPAPDIPDEPPVTVVPIERPIERPPLVILPPTDRAVPVELLPATLTIRTRVCDNDGFDPYSSWDLEKMEAECPLLTDSMGISIYTPALALSKVTFGGVVSFAVRANTTVTLESVRPEGYDISRYTCASPLQERQWQSQQDKIAPLSLRTGIGEAIECTWFFVRNNDDVNLRLTKLACPWFDPSTLAKAKAYCGGTRGTWGDVVLSDTDPSTPNILRPASGDYQLSFVDLPPGTYTVTETNVTAGTAWTYVAHCFITDATVGGPKPVFPLLTSTTFSVALDHAGDTMVCISINVAAAPSGDRPSEVAQAGPQPMALARVPRVAHSARRKGGYVSVTRVRA